MAEDTKPTEPASSKLTPQDVTSVTKHHPISGKALKYTVTCGTVVLREEHDKDGEARWMRGRGLRCSSSPTRWMACAIQRGGRSLIRSMAGRVPARCGCIWGCWGRSG